MAQRLSAAGKPLGRPPKPRAEKPALQSVLKAAKILARYDGAGTGRRMAGWTPPHSGPNSSMAGMQRLQDRAQDSVRNDWAAESTTAKWTTALIGVGIVPRFKRIKSVERRREITDLFMRQSAVLDADCVLDYFGQQTLVTRTWFVAGECFGRLRARFTDEGLPLPFQVQLLEPDMVPMLDAVQWQGLPTGNYIRSGIEFNRRGKRVAYWVYKQHPADGNVISQAPNDYVRVAASEMLHVFEVKRPGQIRGVSSLAPILVKLRDVGDYEDAVLTRQKIANLFVAFIKRTLPSLDPTDPIYGALTGAVAELNADQVGASTDVGGTPLLPMAPGLMQELEDGQEVQFVNPPEAGTNYSDYMRTQHMGTSAATGLPYELMSGDIRGVSDRTLRVLINEFRRMAEQKQWQGIIPMYCQRVIEWFADSAVLTGEISMDEADMVRRVEHAPHGWEYIHPVQDPQGKKLEVDAGFRSRSSVIAARGDDPDLVDDERKSDKDREDALGLTILPPAVAAPADPTKKPPTPLERAQINALNAQARAAERDTPPANTTVNVAAPVFNQGDTTLNVPPAETTVNVENKVEPTPVNTTVNVENKVEPTPVNTTVHVENNVPPSEVNVHLPKRKTEATVTYDANGNIASTTQIESDVDE